MNMNQIKAVKRGIAYFLQLAPDSVVILDLVEESKQQSKFRRNVVCTWIHKGTGIKGDAGFEYNPADGRRHPIVRRAYVYTRVDDIPTADCTTIRPGNGGEDV